MNRRIEVQRHIPALDGVRGVAILLVFISHRFSFHVQVHSLATKIFHSFSNSGWIGVDMFFVLSGFLITGNLIRSRQYENYYQVFYFHRLLRIFPLYYLTLIVAFLFLPHYGASAQMWFWLNLSNFPIAFYPALVPALAHFWSLAVEEQFYAVWPTVVRRFELKTIAITCVVIIASLFVIRNLPVTIAFYYRNPNALYFLTPFRIDTLCGGALLAVIAYQWPELLGHRWIVRGLFLISTVVFIATAFGRLPSSQPIIRLGYTCMVVAFTSLIALCISREGLTQRVFSNGFLRRMGNYSYCFYLIHPFLVAYGNNHPFLRDQISARLHLTTSPNVSLTVLALIEFSVAYLISAISYRYFEQPILRLKKLYPFRNPTVGETTPEISPALPA